MKERPILMAGEVVTPTLADIKTQTRRVVREKVVPIVEECFRVNGKWCNHTFGYDLVDLCPYGKPGDRLYVRETWAPFDLGTIEAQDTKEIFYRADDPAKYASDGSWRPSIHMPRWASRIMLEITNVCVQRLQDITEADAKAEGVEALPASEALELNISPGGKHGMVDLGSSYRYGFQNLWHKLTKNPDFGWHANPWVWVIEFKRINLCTTKL